MEKEKYVVTILEHGTEKKLKVEGKPQIDFDGYLKFGRDDYVFNHGAWLWFKKDTE